jgi:hypothetical protein
MLESGYAAEDLSLGRQKTACTKHLYSLQYQNTFASVQSLLTPIRDKLASERPNIKT